MAAATVVVLGRIADPDPHGSRRAKMTHKKKKKVKKFHVLNCWMFSFEGLN